MNAQFWTATAIFVAAYALIITEKVHKTVVALCGASLVLLLGILSQREAFRSPELGVDWNVIFLLLSMMIIVDLMKPSGVFEYIAIKSAKLGRGSPAGILVIFSLVTAVMSALLDNITTVLLITPVTVLVADSLEVDAMPFLISCALASNIGGTATLIGDPPNIMIASRAGLTFMDFLRNLAPVIAVILVFYAAAVKLIWGRSLRTTDYLKARVMAMDERGAIRDWPLLVKSLAVLGAVLAGFVLHDRLGLQPATVALSGAALMLLMARKDAPAGSLLAVEWSTLFFFIGLFIIVGGVVKVGLIEWMSVKAIAITRGNLLGTSMAVMWFSALASAFIDNIPFVATMNPMISGMARDLWPGLSGPQLLHQPGLMPVWWSLALGACLGGNGTAIGASANVVVVGMAEGMGKKISFGRFMLYGMPLMLMTVAISALYVWLRYFVFGMY